MISSEQFDAVNDELVEVGVRFVGVDDNALVFEVLRKSERYNQPVGEISATARRLLANSEDSRVRVLLDEARSRNMRFVFY